MILLHILLLAYLFSVGTYLVMLLLHSEPLSARQLFVRTLLAWVPIYNTLCAWALWQIMK